MRLSFGVESPDPIEEGIRRLGAAVGAVREGNCRRGLRDVLVIAE
jgi:hypothetical protein